MTHPPLKKSEKSEINLKWEDIEKTRSGIDLHEHLIKSANQYIYQSRLESLTISD